MSELLDDDDELLPDEDELTALYDRFMIRFMVDYISEEFRFLKMLEGARPEARTVMTFAELDAARADAAKVSLPSGIIRSIADLRRELGAQQIIVSDRRWRNSLDVLRAHAIETLKTFLPKRDVADA